MLPGVEEACDRKDAGPSRAGSESGGTFRPAHVGEVQEEREHDVEDEEGHRQAPAIV